MASDGNGTFVVAWQRSGQEGDGTAGVFAQRFRSDGIFADGFGS
jgi:hypothetical protein